MIIQVSATDLAGRKFNGYDLHVSLIEKGIDARQFVMQKTSSNPTVIEMGSKNSLFCSQIASVHERQLGVESLISQGGSFLLCNEIYKGADLAHYHLILFNTLSLIDFKRLISGKTSVWTIHDFWPITGGCTYPLECGNWKNQCKQCVCENKPDFISPVSHPHQMYKIKEQTYKDADIDIIVASNFTEHTIKQSPIMKNKRIHKIPFGLDDEAFEMINSQTAKHQLNIPEDNLVIAFRNEARHIKGRAFIEAVLEKMPDNKKLTVLTCGEYKLPELVKRKFHSVELGWQNDRGLMQNFFAACDVFIMPSLAETFGLMAIEAMAASKPIVIFEKTVLEEITFAPECGVAVPYKDSEALFAVVMRLLKNQDEREKRGELGRQMAKKNYRYNYYINKHIELYNEILYRRKRNA